MARLTLLVLALLVPAAPPVEDTFESVQADFRRSVAALADAVEDPAQDLSERVAELAEQTFGAHPGLVRRATLARLEDLPAFAVSRLEELALHAPAVDLPRLPPEATSPWLAVGGDPSRIGEWAKTWLLARQLGTREFGRRSLLNSYCPDGTSRLDGGAGLALVVESLDDVFVVGVEVTARDGLAPTSVRWLRPR